MLRFIGENYRHVELSYQGEDWKISATDPLGFVINETGGLFVILTKVFNPISGHAKAVKAQRQRQLKQIIHSPHENKKDQQRERTKN